MSIEQQGILAGMHEAIIAQSKKPGPLTSAVQMTGIAAPVQMEQPKPVSQDPFAYRGGVSYGGAGPVNGPGSTGPRPFSRGIADPAPGVSKMGNESSIGTVDQGTDAVGKPELKQPSGEHGVSQNTGIAAPMASNMPATSKAPWGDGLYISNIDRLISERKLFNNAVGDGVADMSILSGIAGMPQGNPKLGTAEDNLRQISNIKASRESIPQGGVGILGDGGIQASNDEKTARWRQDELINKMKYNPNLASLGNAVMASINGENQRGIAELNAGVTTREQDLQASNEAKRIAGLPQDRKMMDAKLQGILAQNESAQQLGEVRSRYMAETDPTKKAAIAAEIQVLSGKARPVTEQNGRLTLPQRRSNFEIEAARKSVSGMTPEEIKRKTANFTATGRENPEYDPALSKAVSLAGRRMYGDDAEFDQRQQAKQPVGNDGDVITRFRADTGMKGHNLGKQTDLGTEVLDASGKLIGHYR